MYVIMLGAPGTGKGTVGNLLSRELNVPHISSGEIFRSYVKKHGEIGKKIDSFISYGRLVPDDLAIELIEKRLQETDVENGAILDGFPRTLPQAKVLDTMLKNNNKKIEVAVNLSLPDEEIISRIVTRRTCPNPMCREIYNLDYNPPKVEGICNKCGTKLIQRSDDNEETVKERLKIYHQISENIIDYYKNKDLLYTVKLNNSSNTTTKDVAKEIKEYLLK
ncbi:MAG: adenylate kinase [Lachnospiraceae bacterium]|nr:adenylate kinase [Lachnospiraceae bacterium]